MTRLSPLGPKSDAVAAARDLLSARSRRQQRRFLAEGPQAVTAALAAGWVEYLFTESDESELALAARAAGVRTYLVTDRAIAALSDTVTPQGPIAVCRMPEVDAEAIKSAAGFLVVCDQVSDPGNLGTIIRTAAAAGAAAVLSTAGSADFWSGKVLRATAGCFPLLPLLNLAGAQEVRELLADREMLATAADANLQLGSAELTAKLARPHAWAIGSEAHGLRPELRAAGTAVRIPMAAGVESLNAAVAAALCMYESMRSQPNF